MEILTTKREHYFITLEITEGCGARVQPNINKAYQEWKDAFDMLPSDLKEKYASMAPPPKPHQATNDGSFGLATGIKRLL